MIGRYQPKDSKGNSCGQLVVDVLRKRYDSVCSWFEGYKMGDHHMVFDMEGVTVYASDEINSKVSICGTNKSEIDRTRMTIERLFENLNYSIKLEE
jgi:hypothetical protein